MTIDLAPSRDPVDLIDSIWAARRGNCRDVLPQLLSLLEHQEPTVREEIVSLVFVKWREVAHRHHLERIIRADADPGVRARAIGALATISEPLTRAGDLEALRGFVLDRHESEQVRKAAYESFVLLARNEIARIDDDADLDEDVDLEWVRSLMT